MIYVTGILKSKNFILITYCSVLRTSRAGDVAERKKHNEKPAA